MERDVAAPSSMAGLWSFYRLLGLEIEPAAPGHSLIRLGIKGELQDTCGDVHGGVIASLLDAAIAVAVSSSLDGQTGATAVSLTINYLEPGRGPLIGSGRIISAGDTLAMAEA